MLRASCWRREFSGQPLTEFWRHTLSGCQVCNWGIQYHLCSTYRGLWGLAVVRLSWLSGRALLPAWGKILWEYRLRVSLTSHPPWEARVYFCLQAKDPLPRLSTRVLMSQQWFWNAFIDSRRAHLFQEDSCCDAGSFKSYIFQVGRRLSHQHLLMSIDIHNIWIYLC